MIRDVFVRSGYNYDVDQASLNTGLDTSGYVVQETGEFVLTPSLTAQADAVEADINTLVRRFGITGQMPQGVRMPTFQDFRSVFDFQSAMDSVATARESFLEMPAEVRYRFGNDPQAFVSFCSDPANLEEAKRLGLVVAPKAEPAAPVVPVVPPVTPSP